MKEVGIFVSLCVICFSLYSGRVYLQGQQHSPKELQLVHSEQALFHARALQAAGTDDENLLVKLLDCVANDSLNLECLATAAFDGIETDVFGPFDDFFGCAVNDILDLECLMDAVAEEEDAMAETFRLCVVPELFSFDMICFFDRLFTGVSDNQDATNPMVLLRSMVGCTSEFDPACIMDGISNYFLVGQEGNKQATALDDVIPGGGAPAAFSLSDALDCAAEDIFDIECYLTAFFPEDGDDDSMLGNALECASEDLFDFECYIEALFPENDGDDDSILANALECAGEDLFDIECYLEALFPEGDDDSILGSVLECAGEEFFDFQCYITAILASDDDDAAASDDIFSPIGNTLNCLFTDALNIECYLGAVLGTDAQTSLSLLGGDDASGNSSPFGTVGNMFTCLTDSTLECFLGQLFPEEQEFTIVRQNTLPDGTVEEIISYDTTTSIGKVMSCVTMTVDEITGSESEAVDMNCVAAFPDVDLDTPFSRLNIFTKVRTCYSSVSSLAQVNCLTSTNEGTSEWMFEVMVNSRKQLASQLAAQQQLNLFSGLTLCAQDSSNFDCFADLITQGLDNSDTNVISDALLAGMSCMGISNGQVNMNCMLNVVLPSGSATSFNNLESPLDVVDTLLGCYTGSSGSSCVLNELVPDVDLSECIQGGISLDMECGGALVASNSASTEDDLNGWNLLSQLSVCQDGFLLELPCALESSDGFSVLLSEAMNNQQNLIDAAEIAASIQDNLDLGGLMTGLDGLGIDAADLGGGSSIGLGSGSGKLDDLTGGLSQSLDGLNDAIQDIVDDISDQAQGALGAIANLRQTQEWWNL